MLIARAEICRQVVIKGVADMPKETFSKYITQTSYYFVPRMKLNTKFLLANWRDGLAKKLRNFAQSVGFAKYCNAIVSEWLSENANFANLKLGNFIVTLFIKTLFLKIIMVVWDSWISLCAVFRNFSTGRSPKTRSGMAISLPSLKQIIAIRDVNAGLFENVITFIFVLKSLILRFLRFSFNF